MTSWALRFEATVGRLQLDIELVGGDRPLALIGPNGSGKTSVLRAIVGALPCTREELSIGREQLAHSTSGLRSPIEERRIGFVPQDGALFGHLSALDNVGFGLLVRKIHRASRSDARERAFEMLKRVQAEHLADQMPSELSGGERQKVALARALILKPRLLLLDEPLSALDACARRQTRAILAEVIGESSTPAILVTHDHRDVRALNAQVAVLHNGRIAQQGDLTELIARPGSAFVQEFTSGLSGAGTQSD